MPTKPIASVGDMQAGLPGWTDSCTETPAGELAASSVIEDELACRHRAR